MEVFVVGIGGRTSARVCVPKRGMHVGGIHLGVRHQVTDDGVGRLKPFQLLRGRDRQVRTGRLLQLGPELLHQRGVVLDLGQHLLVGRDVVRLHHLLLVGLVGRLFRNDDQEVVVELHNPVPYVTLGHEYDLDGSVIVVLDVDDANALFLFELLHKLVEARGLGVHRGFHVEHGQYFAFEYLVILHAVRNVEMVWQFVVRTPNLAAVALYLFTLFAYKTRPTDFRIFDGKFRKIDVFGIDIFRSRGHVLINLII